MRQVQERQQARKKLCYAFVDFEKEFDKSTETGGEKGFEEAGCR